MQPLSIRRRQLAIGASPMAWMWTSAVRRRRERRLFPSGHRSPRCSPSPLVEVLERTRCIAPWWGAGIMLVIVAILVWLWLPSVALDCVAEGLVARCCGPGPGAQTTDEMVETVILDSQLWTPTSHVLQHLFPNFQEIWCRRDNSKCTREVVFRHSCSCLGHSILEVSIGEPDLNKDPAVQPDQGQVKATTTFPWVALSLSITRPFPPSVPVTGATPLSLPPPSPSLENATVKMGAVPAEPTQPTQAESGVIGAPAWLGKVEILSFSRKESTRGGHILLGPIGVAEDHAATTIGQNWDVEPTPLTNARNDKTLFGDGDSSEGGAAAAGERDLAVESALDAPTTSELEGLTPIGFVGLMKTNDSG